MFTYESDVVHPHHNTSFTFGFHYVQLKLRPHRYKCAFVHLSSDVHRQSVHKLLLRFQNSVHRGFGANYNVSVKHSMLLTLATKRHVDLKRRILMRSKLH